MQKSPTMQVDVAMSCSADIYFYRVGHGLFSYGKLTSPNSENTFSWIYDCGSRSRRLISEALNEHTLRHGNEINLLTISHFHKDHINGIENLLKCIDVGTIIVPFIPAWQRLLIGLFSRKYHKTYWSFLQNPINFFSTHAPNARQVYVYREADVEHLKSADIIPSQQDGYFDISNQGQGIIGIKSGDIVEGSFPGWVFIPYNEPIDVHQLPDNFIQNAEGILESLVNTSGTHAAAIHFSSLKQQYDRITKNKNRTSLFLLGEPCYKKYNEKKGVLYTGDGYLKKQTDIDSLVEIMGDISNRIAYFQIMHHGSSYNCQKGLADRIKPIESIIGATSQYNSPPHADVVNEFAPYGLDILGKNSPAWHKTIYFDVGMTTGEIH